MSWQVRLRKGLGTGTSGVPSLRGWCERLVLAAVAADLIGAREYL
jgi:hypothetical protein